MNLEGRDLDHWRRQQRSQRALGRLLRCGASEHRWRDLLYLVMVSRIWWEVNLEARGTSLQVSVLTD